MKRTLRKTLVALMALALMSFNVFAAVPEDVKGQPYENAVSALMEKGIITGDPDGNYYPNAELTRAQACTIIVKAMNPPAADLVVIEEDDSFNDLTGYGWAKGYIALGGSWPNNYIDKATELGLFAEMPDSLPANATKWMAAQMAYSLLGEIEAANAIPAGVKGVMDKVLSMAVKYAKQLDGEFGDRHELLMQSGKGWDYEGYADLKSKLDGFRVNREPIMCTAWLIWIRPTATLKSRLTGRKNRTTG